VKQGLSPNPDAATLATFKDGSAALVRGAAGKGRVYCGGFLPALSYIKSALDERNALQKKVDEKATLTASEQAEAPLLERSYDPWKFPADIRDLILTPARDAQVKTPVQCSAALVDVVYMPHEKGVLLPLANYTLQPVGNLHLTVTVPRRVARAESAVHGKIAFEQSAPGTVELTLPLENNDFVKLMFE
jgi:hypothetical protein